MSNSVDTIILKRYEIIKKVGQGAYGQVWKVKDKRTGEFLALKKMYDAFRNSIDSQRTYREIMYMQLFDHPNITKLLSCIRPSCERDIYITMEFMETDLSTVLKYIWQQLRSKLLKQIHKQFVFYQTVNAVNYLHSGQLLHRDLKPANILLNSKCDVKLCDFGLIRSVRQIGTINPLTENVATRWYRAPQVLLGSQTYHKQADVWSLGCILGEMITAKPILQGTCTFNQIEKIMELIGRPSIEDFFATFQDKETMTLFSAFPNTKKRHFKECFPGADCVMLDLLSRMLQFNPQKRPSLQTVLQHPYLKMFIGKMDEGLASSPFQIPNDSAKLETEQYRQLIYEEIQSGSQPQILTDNSNQPKCRNSLKTLLNNKVQLQVRKNTHWTSNIKSPAHGNNPENCSSQKEEIVPAKRSESNNSLYKRSLSGIKQNNLLFKQTVCEKCRNDSKDSQLSRGQFEQYKPKRMGSSSKQSSLYPINRNEMALSPKKSIREGSSNHNEPRLGPMRQANVQWNPARNETSLAQKEKTKLKSESSKEKYQLKSGLVNSQLYQRSQPNNHPPPSKQKLHTDTPCLDQLQYASYSYKKEIQPRNQLILKQNVQANLSPKNHTSINSPPKYIQQVSSYGLISPSNSYKYPESRPTSGNYFFSHVK